MGGVVAVCDILGGGADQMISAPPHFVLERLMSHFSLYPPNESLTTAPVCGQGRKE